MDLDTLQQISFPKKDSQTDLAPGCVYLLLLLEKYRSLFKKQRAVSSCCFWKPQSSLSSSSFRTEKFPSVCFYCLFVFACNYLFSWRHFFVLQFPEQNPVFSRALWEVLSRTYALLNCASVWEAALFSPMEATSDSGRTAGRRRASFT